MFRSDYLRASDLNGNDTPLTIKDVEVREVGKEDKVCVNFKEQKRALVLNKTNGGLISKMFGDDTRDWAGRQVILFPTVVDFQGEPKDAIRIRYEVPDVNRPLDNEIPFA